ncbi:MAG: hypothetical protein HZA13_00070 [Nitrospirae bacterium]|nr:hypothetical protein [Nitrospirota bacterium]
MRGRLHPALPVEGATQAPINESGSQESEVRSQEKSLDSESSKQRAKRALRGRLHPALPVEGATQAPVIGEIRWRLLSRNLAVHLLVILKG